MVLPDPVVKMIKLFCWILLIGVFFANTIIIMLSFIPFMFAAIGLLIKQPSKINIERHYSKDRVFSGEIIEICLDIEAQDGIGIIEISEILPRHFEVIEGSNYKVLWKGMGILKCRLVYKFRCTTSGTYHIGNAAIKVSHCIYGHVHSSMERSAKIIEVSPRIFDTTKAKSISNFSKIPMPLGNISNMGMSTLEFKEIRQYCYGDSFKLINWKATARNLNKGGYWPIVNDYEKEGKKSVWIYLNISKSMGMGSNIMNSLEAGLEAANSLVDFYLKQNAFVAFGTYNDMQEFIYPGSGQKHYIKILKTILRCSSNIGAVRRTDNRSISLKEAIISNKKYLSGSEPLFIIVTRYYDKFYDSLSEGIDEMSKYASYRKGVYKIMIVNIIGYGMAANSDLEKLTAQLQHLKDYKSIQRLRKKCIWIDWDPSQTSFSKALMSQVVGI
ncbi:MAG TPA: DUF58 domain-containing protein [Pseudobacteroides sp.]|uniref:DUF58 domain-containing protein n=1 Tax=Pseudobacteroides sp. TaxID=1968840 RepID=UPI002F946231